MSLGWNGETCTCWLTGKLSAKRWDEERVTSLCIYARYSRVVHSPEKPTVYIGRCWYLGTLGTLPSQQLLRGHGSLGSHQWQWTFSRRREHLAPTVWRAQIPKTWGDPVTQITPWSSTWNLKISPLKRRFWKLLFSGSMKISSFLWCTHWKLYIERPWNSSNIYSAQNDFQSTSLVFMI